MLCGAASNDGSGWLKRANAGIFAQPMPTGPASRRRRVDRDDLARMLLVTTRLAALRARLKTDAVAGDKQAREELRTLDRAVYSHAKRGARELRALASLVVSQAAKNDDLNAVLATDAPLAGRRWYGLAPDEEATVARFFAGWDAAVEAPPAATSALPNVTPEEAFDEWVFSANAFACMCTIPSAPPLEPKRIEAMRDALRRLGEALDVAEARAGASSPSVSTRSTWQYDAE